MEMAGNRPQHNGRRRGSSTKKLASRLTVKEYVIRWDMQYRRQMSEEEILSLTELYSQDIKRMGWTDNRFEAAAIKVTTKCKFFPTVADLHEADQGNQMMNARAEEEKLNRERNWNRSDLETEHGRAQFANIYEILSGKIDTEEGVSRSKELVKRYGR